MMSCVVEDNCGKTGVVDRAVKPRAAVSTKTFKRPLFVLVDEDLPAVLSRDALCESGFLGRFAEPDAGGWPAYKWLVGMVRDECVARSPLTRLKPEKLANVQ
jgi:hypothetical protein